jgi:hypothetical protein
MLEQISWYGIKTKADRILTEHTVDDIGSPSDLSSLFGNDIDIDFDIYFKEHKEDRCDPMIDRDDTRYPRYGTAWKRLQAILATQCHRRGLQGGSHRTQATPYLDSKGTNTRQGRRESSCNAL